MDLFRIDRRLSFIEGTGRWVALAVAIATMAALFGLQLDDLLGPSATYQDWSDAFDWWRLTLAGTLPTVAVIALAQRLLPTRWLWRFPLLAAAVVAATWLGWQAQSAFDPQCACAATPAAVARAMQHWLFVVAVLVAAFGEYRLAFLRTAHSLHLARLASLALQGELASARLQLLQAQIEPHFLFNTLANVRRLLRTDGVAGRAMLADLLRYLESALPRLRDDHPTLERELECVRAFLGVHQVRMGDRLQVEFDVGPDLMPIAMPPMMLITLVENALKHGIQPLREGGSIAITARHDGDLLCVRVTDTGRGLGIGFGTGTGLSNIRARLHSMYGAAAHLTLRVNEPRGVAATIALPLPTP